MMLRHIPASLIQDASQPETGGRGMQSERTHLNTRHECCLVRVTGMNEFMRFE